MAGSPAVENLFSSFLTWTLTLGCPRSPWSQSFPCRAYGSPDHVTPLPKALLGSLLPAREKNPLAPGPFTVCPLFTSPGSLQPLPHQPSPPLRLRGRSPCLTSHSDQNFMGPEAHIIWGTFLIKFKITQTKWDTQVSTYWEWENKSQQMTNFTKPKDTSNIPKGRKIKYLH